MIKFFVVFDRRLTRAVYDYKHQWLLGSCVKFSQFVVLLKNSFPKLRNSHRSGKIDLTCISVWDV